MVERPKTDTHPHLQQILELPVNLACLQTVKENIHMQKKKKLQSGKQICIRAKDSALLYLLSMLYLFILLKYSDFVVLIKNKNNCYKNVV